MTDYQAQLEQVETALAADPDSAEWLKLRDDLVEVIRLTSELQDVKASASDAVGAGGAGGAGSDAKSYAVGEKCQAIFENEAKWYNAKIVALAADGYFVTFLGYGNTAQVDFAEVRPYARPDTSEWRVGGACSALHSVDGRWYDAKILAIKSAVATVVFQGESESAEVELDAVRVASAAAGAGGAGGAAKGGAAAEAAAAAAAAAEAKHVPKQLEILPDDSEEEKARKKRKLNMHKRQERKANDEKKGESRRTGWAAFSSKNKTVSKAKNFHDPNWDPTTNHGELHSRQIQEGKFQGTDP